jgi:hypothetical protein
MLSEAASLFRVLTEARGHFSHPVNVRGSGAETDSEEVSGRSIATRSLAENVAGWGVQNTHGTARFVHLQRHPQDG